MKLRLIPIFAALSLLVLASCRDKLTGPPNTTTSSDTIAYWTFDGNLKDVTGNGHNGTTGQIAYGPDRFGHASSALLITPNMKPETQTVTVPDAAGLNFTGNDPYTISAWIQTNNSDVIVIGKGPADGSHPGYQLGLSNGLPIAKITSITGQNSISDYPVPSLSDGQWHLLTLVIQAGHNVTLYADSLLYMTYQDPGMEPELQNTAPLLIGSDPTKTTPFSGSIDNVMILNRALDPVEVAARFHEGGWTGGSHVLSDTQSIELLTNTSDTLNGTIAMSGDGMRVACAASDQALDATQGFIYVFDAVKGTVIRKIAKGSWAGHFQLDNGGNQLLLWEGGGAGNATLFNVLTGNVIRTFGADAGQGDFSAALTANGDSVLIFKEYYASGNGTVAFYDSKTGNLLSSYATPLSARFVSLTNADRSIVLLSQDSLSIMDAQTGSWSSSYFSHIGTWVSYWELPSPDGVLIGGYDLATSSFRVVNILTRTELSATNIGNDAFALSSDHTTMAHATGLNSSPGTISFQIDIINIADGSEVKQLSNLDGTFAGGAFLAYSNDGSRLAGECYNGVKVWKIK
ncbi:MAG TPA: LamG domain-containing protein [Candidatus Kapabacteria bacterium]|nr:LamG domain-containing protein [Candidatus Kapabacteria bacterium]